MYRLDEDDSSGDTQGGSIRGGKTFWGEVAGIAKNLGISIDYVLDGTSWQNILMMSADMPHWESNSNEKRKVHKRLPSKLESGDDFKDFLNL